MAQILIVDDDPFIRMLVADVLEMEGYSVRTAADGEAGLFEYTSLRPDCVVLDVMMPGLDGFEVLRRIRAMEDVAVPIVMLTASNEPESTRSAWTVGADFFLSKPFEAEQILEVLASLLSEGPIRPG